MRISMELEQAFEKLQQSSEFKAVMRYFSGASWSKWEEFYGNSVLAIAKQYEQDIKGMQ